MQRPQTVTVRDAARRMSCTLKYVYDLVYAGKLQARKSGREWRIPLAAVEARMQQRESRA